MDTKNNPSEATIMQTYLPSSLPIPVRNESSIRELCAIIAQHRGRPLVVVAIPFQRAVVSMWLVVTWPGTTTTADVIVIPSGSTPSEQDVVIAHELQHMLTIQENKLSSRKTRLSHLKEGEREIGTLPGLLQDLRHKVSQWSDA